MRSPLRWLFALSLVGCAQNHAPSDGGARRDALVAPDAAADGGRDVGACALERCGVLCVDTSTDPSNCGGCARTCVIPNASAACVSGECAVGVCDVGYNDLNADPSDGCESACASGAACETSCGTAGTMACDGDAMTCQPPAESCNLADDNCDGACDEGADCRVGVHRALGGGGHFYTVDLGEITRAGYTLEVANFYSLYRAPQEGTRPFHRCLKGNGLRFYTTSSACEGGGTLEGVMGHIGSGAVCGSRPLYRLYGGGDHFYTTSEAERDNAVSAFGYVFESVAGYVW